MTAPTAALHLDRWRAARSRWEHATTEAAEASAEMDELLTLMCETRPVSHVAADVGLSRQEVHRRIARAR